MDKQIQENKCLACDNGVKANEPYCSSCTERAIREEIKKEQD